MWWLLVQFDQCKADPDGRYAPDDDPYDSNYDTNEEDDHLPYNKAEPEINEFRYQFKNGHISDLKRDGSGADDENIIQVISNDTFDFEEIALTRLTKLRLTYPSMTKPNETQEANQFDAKYKKLNKILPNQYAIRGFDVTFDTLLRLSQEKSFEETVEANASQQIENKFDYMKNETAGYSNRGVYILYYDTDLTIKEAQ